MKKLILKTIGYILIWAFIFYVLHRFNLSGDYVTSITAAAVGYLAYLVYELNQINQLVSAAKILVLDIRNAEVAIQGVIGGANYAAWSKVAVIENNWPKLKQNFVKELNTDEFRNFEQFFHSWTELANAKKRVEEVQFAGLLAKATYTQERLLNLSDEIEPNKRERRDAIITIANTEKFLFEPNLPQEQLSYFISAISPLSGTTGFEKLRRIANIR